MAAVSDLVQDYRGKGSFQSTLADVYVFLTR